MPKVVITPVTGGYNLTQINSNLNKLAVALNDGALWRNNPPGEPNSLHQDIDANGNTLFNVRTPVLPHEAVNKQYADLTVGRGEDAAQRAEAAAIIAENSLKEFQGAYYGGFPTDPTQDPLGNAPTPGDLYFNTTTNRLRAYIGNGQWTEGTGGYVLVEQYSGDGVDVTFTLPEAVEDENNTFVFISGVYQEKAKYSIAGTTLTFAVAPPVGTNNIEVVIQKILPLGVTDSSMVAYPGGHVVSDLANPAHGIGMVAGAERVVDNVAAIRLLVHDLTPKLKTSGYTSPGDGGHSEYYLDNADVTSPDDGLGVIVTASGKRYKLSVRDCVYVEQAGAIGDGRDNTVAIQKVLDYCYPRKLPTRAGVGTFGINLDRTGAVEGYALARCGLYVRDGNSIQGAGMGRTIFKLLDGETDKIVTTLPWFNLILNNTVIYNWELKDITLDINGQNNPISRPGEELPGYTCAGFMTTGSVASVGVDARLYDALFKRVEVKNNPGVTNIGVGSRYNNPGLSGWNIRIEDCKFYNSGIDSRDHSSVFCMADNVSVTGCSFDHPAMSSGVRGPLVAIELHGSDNKASGNTIRNYCQVFWIGAGEDGQRNNVTVENNSAVVSWWGGGIWTNPVHTDPVHNININNNSFWITGDVIEHPGLTGPKYALYMGIGDGVNVLRANVNGNIFYCTDRNTNTGMYLGANTGSFLQTSIITNNLFSGFSVGGLVGAAAGALGNIILKGNVVENCAVTTTIPVNTRGFDFRDTSMFSLELSNNTVNAGDIGQAPAIAINLSGSATYLYLDDNNVDACPVGISDTAIVSGNRVGRQACTFAALPTQSTWKIGDIAYMKPAAFLGTSPNKYIVDGWQRMTAGTANVLGTDWQERRMPTGT